MAANLVRMGIFLERQERLSQGAGAHKVCNQNLRDQTRWQEFFYTIDNTIPDSGQENV